MIKYVLIKLVSDLHRDISDLYFEVDRNKPQKIGNRDVIRTLKALVSYINDAINLCDEEGK